MKTENQNPSPEANPHIPDHNLLRKIGQGSYGEVWLACNVMGTLRAVKIVHRASFESGRPYEREFSGLQKFEPVSRTHPGLVSILHMGRNEVCFYCVMEVADDASTECGVQNAESSRQPHSYVPRTLAYELSKRGRLPLSECVQLGMTLAEALGHLHGHGLVHRDIKPSNIIFVGGQPKLADIGLVTQIGSKATFVGTEGYLAPEGPGSARADLYSLGKVLYEISTGKTQDQFPELPSRLHELPQAAQFMRLNSIIVKLCDQNPGRRFRSAEELCAALSPLRLPCANTQAGASLRAGAFEKYCQVAILASSKLPADASLAKQLTDRLRTEGFSVFNDDGAALSLEWARNIEEQIRNAQVLIPILSAASVQTDFMAYALEVAADAARRPNAIPQIVPLQLYPGPLPRQIAIAVNGATPVRADSTAGLDQTINQLLTSIKHLRI